ncbi:NMDA receptor-regulated protein 1-domain-containing protein [Naematelia encephala]|uniref:NMDA receptor-regulated protein 1-domain-containing protein n=1 Tax=Naematelia encephala TaxID=71784 RepID=A0A1Y2BKY3_9TREE|nr:NMDA receptor-regulated protein 1-domain-containing protein [Naematelia encephala]
MSAAAKQRQLPNKEAGLFKELLTQYELKQYKKGIKAADTILKKFPNHGETLALKALTLHASLPFPITVGALPKQEEAEQMARTAVKKDITSHITWHVLGIIAKTKKDWDEASRAFAMARKQDNDNIPLIRDSISLYLHTRQYSSAVAGRHHYLTLRPQIRSSWLGLMIAHHLNGDIEEALEVYDGLMGCIKTDGASGPEKAQTALHVVRMCIEAGEYKDGLERLERFLRNDVLSARGEATQLKAEMLAKVGRLQEAEDTYRALLEQNSDNLEYYRGFLRTRGLDITETLEAEAVAKTLHALDLFAESYPRSAAPRRLTLDIAQGEAFRDRARTYLINGLERGVPSLFVDVKGVYQDATKMAVVGEIMEELVAELEKNASLHNDATIAPPTTLLWAYYYLALHLSHPSHPNPSPDRSLKLLGIALEHTPTLPELYMAKAMVLKRAGDPYGAAVAMEEARSLDLQDRFLNGKAAKYWLRAGDVKKAEDLVSLFTKKDTSAVSDLTDLQCLWFLTEEGDSYRRNGNLAMALKRYQALVNVFQDYEDDQYDFHTYCMRRMTFSAYMALMRYEDQLRSHPGYFRAAIAAIEIYLKIHDDPTLTEESISPEEEAERKKAAKKAQKAEQKARKAAHASGGDSGKKEDQPVPDEDPTGSKLLKTETPLEDALKLFAPLEHLASERVETWTIAYEIDIRRGRYLGALKCLSEAYAVDAEDPKLHGQILNFRRKLASATDLPEPVKAAIEAVFPSILPTETSPEEFNASFLSRHSTSPRHILGAAQGLLEIKRAIDPVPSDTLAEVIAILNQITTDNVPPAVPIMLEAVDFLRSAGAAPEQVDTFRKRCTDRAPLAWVLATEDEQKRRKTQGMDMDDEGGANGNGNGNVKADV